MESVFLTDKGKVRPHNEDSGGIYQSDNGRLLAIVADGMGGHLAGDIASSMAVKQLEQAWLQVRDEFTNPEQAEKWIKTQVQKANEHLYQYALNHQDCKGMGTTLVLAVCTMDFITVGHIGDSRCYILNENGFSQLTEDHSLVNELVRSGEITKEDAEHHPRKNVLLRALGTEQTVEVDIKTIGWDVGDTILLCSDGLSNKVSEKELEKMLANPNGLEEKGKMLIDSANAAGGEDNITLSIVKFVTTPESG